MCPRSSTCRALSRARGLERARRAMGARALESRPLTGAWVGTTWTRRSTSSCPSRALSRARGLDPVRRRYRGFDGARRALSRARGLEPDERRGHLQVAEPRPLTGAWVGTRGGGRIASTGCCRALSRARGLERDLPRQAEHQRRVAPSHGRVGWNMYGATARGLELWSRPLTGAWVGTHGTPTGGAWPRSRALSRARGLEPDGTLERLDARRPCPLMGMWVGTPLRNRHRSPSPRRPSCGHVGWNSGVARRLPPQLGRALLRARELEPGRDGRRRYRGMSCPSLACGLNLAVTSQPLTCVFGTG